MTTFKLHDLVTSDEFGNGKVVAITQYHSYPIVVKFDSSKIPVNIPFTSDGRWAIEIINPHRDIKLVHRNFVMDDMVIDVNGCVGIVILVEPDTYDGVYPITVRFPDGSISTYTKSGKYSVLPGYEDRNIQIFNPPKCKVKSQFTPNDQSVGDTTPPQFNVYDNVLVDDIYDGKIVGIDFSVSEYRDYFVRTNDNAAIRIAEHRLTIKSTTTR